MDTSPPRGLAENLRCDPTRGSSITQDLRWLGRRPSSVLVGGGVLGPGLFLFEAKEGGGIYPPGN